MMTITEKKAMFLINKRITVKHNLGQLTIILCALIIVFCFLYLIDCNGKKVDEPVVPPVTSPLSREYIGFGVITASFTHLTADPADSASIGYLRRGSLVRILKRQTIKTGNDFVSWVLTDGTADDTNTGGWLKEDVMDIYDNESQARTASETVLK